MSLCEIKFEETYRKSPEGVAFCPYRICPVGAHVDHQLGKVTGFALDKGIHIAYAQKTNGVVEIRSMQFDKRAQWHVRAVPEAGTGDWANYLRGATLELQKRYPLQNGVSAVIEGSLPIGGLSSSSAVTIAFLKALSAVNGIHLDPLEMVNLALNAERNYVGVSCGKLDQSCEVYSKAGHLLYLDTSDDSYSLIATPRNMKPYRIMVFFSGVERTLVGSAYNMRVDECKSAAYALKAFSGAVYGKYSDTVCRQVPREVFLEYRDRLPEPWRKRADHWYGEQDRVEKAVSEWTAGDIDAFGRLVFESGASSIDNYETGGPELKTLFEIMKETDGIYGGRFSGAGFRGCCMAIVDPAYEESIADSVGRRYLEAFPQYRDKFVSVVCDSSDGIKL